MNSRSVVLPLIMMLCTTILPSSYQVLTNLKKYWVCVYVMFLATTSFNIVCNIAWVISVLNLHNPPEDGVTLRRNISGKTK
jgi:hypothetical protein